MIRNLLEAGRGPLLLFHFASSWETSTSRENLFDDFLQFHGRNIFNFPFLVSSQASRYSLKNFYVIQGVLLHVLVFKFFCKLFNFFVADGCKPARHAFILNNNSTNVTRETNSTKVKGGNRDVIERYDTHKGDIRKICHSGPGWSGVWNLWVV